MDFCFLSLVALPLLLMNFLRSGHSLRLRYEVLHKFRSALLKLQAPSDMLGREFFFISQLMNEILSFAYTPN